MLPTYSSSISGDSLFHSTTSQFLQSVPTGAAYHTAIAPHLYLSCIPSNGHRNSQSPYHQDTTRCAFWMPRNEWYYAYSSRSAYSTKYAPVPPAAQHGLYPGPDSKMAEHSQVVQQYMSQLFSAIRRRSGLDSDFWMCVRILDIATYDIHPTLSIIVTFTLSPDCLLILARMSLRKPMIEHTDFDLHIALHDYTCNHMLPSILINLKLWNLSVSHYAHYRKLKNSSIRSICRG